MRGVAPFSASLIACAAASAAHSADATSWIAKPGLQQCTITGTVVDSGGAPGGSLLISWSRDRGYTLQVSLQPSAPVGRWRLDSTGTGASREIISGTDKFLLVQFEAGDMVRRDLAAGRAMDLTIEARDGAHRYTTGTTGAKAALRVLDKCVADIQATPAPQPPPPRWTADTQSGRDCRLGLSGFAGVRGIHADFRAGQKGSPRFDVFPDDDLYPHGGIMRIALPDAAQPWTFDTKNYSATPDPRNATLLAELRRMKPVEMTFTPPGGKPIPMRTATDGLAVAGAMFEACAVALRHDTLPPRFSFSELRYAVSEYEDFCELTGTFQIDGNGIWLTLVTDGKKNVLKSTRRTLKAGYLIQSLDLRKLGGARNLTAQDAAVEIAAPAFAALRRDLLDKGRDFDIIMSRVKRYTGQFGGPFAVVEAPMFDACVRAKFETR